MAETKRIVIIDDEKDFGLLMRDILDRAGTYEVFLAGDPEEGQALCAQHIPHLVFVDFIMPKVRGDRIVEFLREQPLTRNTTIVMMSGLVEVGLAEAEGRGNGGEKSILQIVKDKQTAGRKWISLSPGETAQCGINVFLAKPFSKNVLLELVRSLLENQ